MAEAKVYQAKDPAALTRFVVIVLWIDLAVGLLSALSGLIELSHFSGLPRDTPVSFSQGTPLPDSLALLSALMGLIQVLSTLITGFFCLKWIYRVSLNAHVLVKDLANTPGWAIGWYFIPFANLLKPFQALREAWQASLNPAFWKSVDPPPLMRWWWGLWLVNGFLGNISFRLALSAKSLDMLTASDVFQVVADLAGLPLNIVFIVLMQRLCDHQVKALSQQVFA